MQNEANSRKETAYPLSDLMNKGSIVFYQCTLEEDFPIVFISKNISSILGYQPKDFYRNSTFWIDKIHPDDREEVQHSFLQIMDIEQRVFEYRMRHKDGSHLWIRDENNVIYDEEGNPKGISGSAINISGRKKAEEEVRILNNTLEQRIKERTRELTDANRKLKKQIQYRNKAERKISLQEKKLHLLELSVANINDMVIVSRAPKDNPMDLEIVFVNNSFESFTGYSIEEVREQGLGLLHGEETSERMLDKINRRIQQHKPVRAELINYKKDGTPYGVELDLVSFPAEDDEYEYWVSINRDITKRKRMEQSLEESEHRYRAYSELSFDAIFEITLDGIITDCNVCACNMFGYTRNELIGMNTLELTPEKYRDAQPEIFSEEITTGHEAWERKYCRKDGSILHTEINTKIYNRGGEDRLIAYVRDISEQKKYEKTIRDSLKEKEVLLAEIHHRVKNNLAIICGLLEMQVFNADNEKITDALNESQSRIQSIAMVHERLYQSDSFADITIDTYIQELLSYIRETFGGKHEKVSVDQQIDAISLDVNQAIPMGLILNELITNAYKHAFTNGREGRLLICLKESGDSIKLKVEDNGPGLPGDFNIHNSSSLGMTLIQTLVEQIEGSLEIDGENGTSFSVTFSPAIIE